MARLKDEYASRMVAELEKKLGTTNRMLVPRLMKVVLNMAFGIVSKDEQKALVEDYNDQMLTQRNLGMRDRALEWMEAGDKVFFAVGAAHLMDEDGLVALLRAEGYTVEQIEY